MRNDRSPRTQAIIDLLAAHHELTSLEWLECRQSVTNAAAWGGVALVAALGALLGVDALLFILLRDPLVALGALTTFNAGAAVLAAFQARRKLTQPFFVLSKREASHDLQLVLRELS
jgi:uncharacterized membrane protein YqjE